MEEDKLKQILIGGRLIGIIGLDDAIKKTSDKIQSNSEDEIKKNLLKEVSLNNYIPTSALEAYGNALLREFRTANGIAVPPDPSTGFNIEVIGMGCARCSQLETDVRDLLSEMKIAANLRHVTNAKEIARYNLLGSPALAINNKIVSVGDVPPKSKIREWIIEALQAQK